MKFVLFPPVSRAYITKSSKEDFYIINRFAKFIDNLKDLIRVHKGIFLIAESCLTILSTIELCWSIILIRICNLITRIASCCHCTCNSYTSNISIFFYKSTSRSSYSCVCYRFRHTITRLLRPYT